MRISDWSSDVCSSDLFYDDEHHNCEQAHRSADGDERIRPATGRNLDHSEDDRPDRDNYGHSAHPIDRWMLLLAGLRDTACQPGQNRSEEQTSELQSLMRNSYAVFCLKKNKKKQTKHSKEKTTTT